MKKLFTTLVFTALFVAKHNAQNIQLAHNSCDATPVKVWVNDTVWINSFVFQHATPVWNCMAGNYTIGISSTTATAQSQSIVQQTINVQSAQSHFLVLNGIVTASTYTPNNVTHPLVVTDFSQGSVGQPSPFQVSARFHNGSTYYNPVLTITDNSGTLAANIGYGQNGYSGLMGMTNTFVTLSSPTTIDAYFSIPYQNYAGTNMNVVINDCDPIALAEGKQKAGFALLIVAPSGNVEHLTQLWTTGIHEQGAGSVDVMVGPNPANSALHVRLSGNSDHAVNLQITDITGKKVKAMNFPAMSAETAVDVDVKQLDPGIYFLNISCGTAKKSVRFIKE